MISGVGGGGASQSLCQPFVDLRAISRCLIDCAPAFWHINQQIWRRSYAFQINWRPRQCIRQFSPRSCLPHRTHTSTSMQCSGDWRPSWTVATLALYQGRLLAEANPPLYTSSFLLPILSPFTAANRGLGRCKRAGPRSDNLQSS